MKSAQLKTFLTSMELGLSFVDNLPTDFESYYKVIDVKKRAGGLRRIRIPDAELKWLQSRIFRDYLRPKFIFPEHVHGGVRKRNIKSYAERHIDQKIVINLDLVNFFDCITRVQVESALKTLHLAKDLRVLLAFLCTVNDALPQGAPTSPFLANLVALELDNKLLKIAGKYKAEYSRYIDDLSFSGDLDADLFLEEVHDAISAAGFKANKKKTRIQRSHRQQTVASVVVNKRSSVSRQYLKTIRHDLHFAKRFGVYGHTSETQISGSFMHQLAARIGYVISVDPEKGLELKKQFKEIQDYVETERHCKKLRDLQTNREVALE